MSPECLEILAELALDASDQLGRTISHSAIARAVLRLSKGQERAILEQVEAELASGTRWGHKQGWKIKRKDKTHKKGDT